VTLDRRAAAELERPIESLRDLVDYFRAGEKARERWRVGVEHEKLGLRRIGGRWEPIPYDGPGGVEALLRHLAAPEAGGAPSPWAAVEEDGRVVGLDGPGGISLEPGGQLEQNGRPHATLHETCAEFHEHLAHLRRVSEPLGIAWLGLGCHPFHPSKELPQVPRERYRIMRRYLPTRGELALDMMHATASVQASFDWSDETDLVDKLRTALAVTPIAAALFANSSLHEGRPSGFVSRRLWIWQHTDPDRTGLLPFAFEPGFGYARYAEWALDVPMFFIVRDGRYRPMQGRTFRRFWQEGFEGERATLADWDRHLTTLFPEVRIKRILEVRSADAVPPDLLCTVPALWKGVLYDEEARRAATALARWGPGEARALQLAVSKRGLAAETPAGPLLPLARELAALAREGLRRQVRESAGAPDERRFLEPLEAQLELGRSPGEIVLERWQGAWGGDPDRLIGHARY
jgi:glutamate--cysteine ligase